MISLHDPHHLDWVGTLLKVFLTLDAILLASYC